MASFCEKNSTSFFNNFFKQSVKYSVWSLIDIVSSGTQSCGHSPCSEGEVLGHSEECWFSCLTGHSRLHPTSVAVQRAVMVNLQWEKMSRFTLKVVHLLQQIIVQTRLTSTKLKCVTSNDHSAHFSCSTQHGFYCLLPHGLMGNSS